MSVDRLSADDIEVVRQCLIAAFDGPFFPDCEFHTLIGLTRTEVATVSAEWPTCADEKAQDVAVRNVLNNLLGYPHGGHGAWSAYITATEADVAGVLARWRGEDGFDAPGRG
jgi:hypothetical protein